MSVILPISRPSFLGGLVLSGLLLCPLPGLAEQTAPPNLPAGYSPPEAIFRVNPTYPWTMRRLGIGSEVLIAFVVTRDGTVTDIYPVRSNHPAFEEAAVAAVARWRFRPGRVNDRPVNIRMQVPIFLNIEGGKAEPWIIKCPETFAADIPPEFHWETAPRLINYSPPVYPRDAWLAKQGGEVNVVFIVDTAGRVTSRKIASEAPPDFAAASLAAVDTFRFEPARRGDAPSLALLRMRFNFNPGGRGDVPVSPEDSRLARLLQRTPEKIATLAQLDAAPKPRSRRSPLMPRSFRQNGEPGESLIEFIIDHRGFARLPRVLSATHPSLATPPSTPSTPGASSRP